jgi:3'(2'), 5'-bisphosphate nucleotidase
MSETYQNERGVAVRAVREASRLCRAVRTGVAPESLAKADLSPVTVADYGSQALVCRALGEAFPAVPVIAEEDSADLRRPENASLRDEVLRHVRRFLPETDLERLFGWIDRGGTTTYSERFWTLDPIDGTKGYLRGEQYAVALALIVDGRVEVAALACPNLPAGPGAAGTQGAIFAAVRGRGASVLPIDAEGTEMPARVSVVGALAAARVCESVESGHSAHGAASRVMAELGMAAPPVRLDSQAKYAVVARGEAEVYLRLPTSADYREKIWDHAAGVLVVEEAGGTVTDLAGRPLEFTHGRELTANRGVIVTNGRLHARVLEVLENLGLAG